MAEEIDKRYEAANAQLNAVPLEEISADAQTLTHFFRAKSGILLREEEFHRVLTVDFIDKNSC